MSDRDERRRPVYGIALPPSPVPSSDITIALVVHVLGGVLAVVGLYHNLWVLAALVPAIVLLLASRKDHPWRREEARTALNFQITCVAATLLLQGIALLAAVLLVGNGQTALALSLFAVLLLIQSVIAIFDLVVSVLAAIRTRSGGGFRYPLKLELVK
jgi:uncharacterized Tic20 family protein